MPFDVVCWKVERPRSSASWRDFAGGGGGMMTAFVGSCAGKPPFGGIFDAV